MYQVDEEQIETLHIYLEQKKPPQPSLLPIVLSVAALLALVAIGVLSPSQQPVTRTFLRVPAVPLAVKTFTADAPIIPTGLKTHPATTAHGILTITDGSIIAQVIPAGFTIQDVVTDRAVYVPPGSANGYGYATVSAHALTAGTQGNIPPYTVNYVEGSSVYIRNLSAFSGGRDSYSVKFVTAQDKQAARLRAQVILLSKIRGLHYPCREYVQLLTKMIVTWRCQMLTYHIPALYHVTSVRLSGKKLILSVWFIPRPTYTWVK